ncbi:hypothetical protein [uncultured Fibrella sp.]|uniref:hypothetical protein n=1 Tax=uncultured Fibrella sp. TaxID=1284596 RepID=UPI0035CB3D88
MELTHSYTSQVAFSRLRSSLKQSITRFVNQNPDVFEAISRTGTPFGGSTRPARQATDATIGQPTQQELALMQRQLNELTEQVAQLTSKLNASQPALPERLLDGTRKPSMAPGKQIGIDRFWALQEKKQTMA